MATHSLRDLRGLNVAIMHPEDADCLVLVKQLMRIGCRFEVFWPPPDNPPVWADVLFVKVDSSVSERLRRQWNDRGIPAVVALVDFEDPTTLEAMLGLQPNAVIGKPLQPQGVLANLVVARHARGVISNFRKDIEKLRSRLDSVKTLTQAKAILMEHLHISEPKAYELLRKEAMHERVPLEQVAQGLVISGKLMRQLPILTEEQGDAQSILTKNKIDQNMKPSSMAKMHRR